MSFVELVEALPLAVVLVTDEGQVDYVNARAKGLFRASGLSVEWDDFARTMAGFPPLKGARFEEGDPAQPRLTVDSLEGPRTFGYQTTRLANGSRLIAFQDVTELEQTQRERNRLLQLASISEVMPAVLHELKNPLAGITLMMELLIEDAPDENRERLHAILSEVRRLTLTLDGLGRFRHEVRSTRHWPVDLALREAFSLLEPQAASRGITAVVDVKDMPLLPFDPAAIRAVLFNLVTNSIHACQPGQRIEVHADFDRPNTTLMLTVSDTGAGMPRAVRDRCTELFFTTKPRGSGIGLALCAGVAEAVGGALRIDSNPGLGTTISLALPVTPAGAA